MYVEFDFHPPVTLAVYLLLANLFQVKAHGCIYVVGIHHAEYGAVYIEFDFHSAVMLIVYLLLANLFQAKAQLSSTYAPYSEMLQPILLICMLN